MRLRLDPCGFGTGKGTHVSLFFYIRSGPFDDILQWPFKNDVELSLIDQESGAANLTDTVKYSDGPNLTKVYMKPITEENYGFGSYKFIKLSEILTNSALIRNNQIFIKCQSSKLP